MDLTKALAISARGMDAQGTRLHAIAENLANQDSNPPAPEPPPAHRRKSVAFENVVDGTLGVETVRAREVGPDESDGPVTYHPRQPGIPPKAQVRRSNVAEIIDMREAQRAYGANLAVMQASRSVLARAIDMLK